MRTKIEIAAAILALILALLAFRSWLAEHDLRLKTQATVEVQQKAFDSATLSIAQLQEAEKARDAQTAATIATIQATAAKQVTPQQIAAWLPKQVAGLPQPITIQMPTPTAQNPNPEATATIPAADLPALRTDVENCQECAVNLSAAQADATSKQQQLTAAGAQLSAVENERDGYKAELAGGTFWMRVKRGAKMLAIGGAIAAGALCGTGHCK